MRYSTPSRPVLHRALLHALHRRSLAHQLNGVMRHNRAVVERAIAPEAFLERLFKSP